MLPTSQILVIDRALPPSLLASVYDEVSGLSFTYGWKSARGSDPHGHWNRKIISAPKRSINDQRDKLAAANMPACAAYIDWLTENVVGPNALLRYYVNAHTYGVDGYPHRDTKRERGEKTVLLYLSPNWRPDWAGETVLLTADGTDIERAVMPRFGRVFIFPSERMHAARAVSRLCSALRVTLVCKLGPVNE